MAKNYTFTFEEVTILRDALIEYKQFIKPEPDASDNRKGRYAAACELAQQFRDDARLMK